MKIILFNSFKQNKLTCNCKLFCCCPVKSNPCQTSRPVEVDNTFKTSYIEPFINAFNEGQDVFELCITIKPDFLNPTHIKGKSHIDIFNLIERKLILFLRKYKLQTTKILLITEYSDKCRLHFHGCILKPFSYELADNLRQQLCKFIGRSTVNIVKHKNYFDYIIKDTHKNYSIPGFMKINY